MSLWSAARRESRGEKDKKEPVVDTSKHPVMKQHNSFGIFIHQKSVETGNAKREL